MLITSLISLLISNAITSRRDQSILYSRVFLLMLVSCAVICFNSVYLTFLDRGIGLLGGLYSASVISQIFHLFLLITTFLIMLFNSFYPIKWTLYDTYSNSEKLIKKLSYFNFLKINRISQQYKIIEYSLIILFILTGGVFLVSSSDFISLFLCIELQSYGLYILSAIYRDSERAMSGALTYFLLGGLSSCFILLGSGLLYSNTGNTGFDGLYAINNICNLFSDSGEQVTINFSLTLISIGFLFKITAAPFHFWGPDVYDAIPTVVTSFVAIFAKISILVLLLELVRYTSRYTIIYDEPSNIDLPKLALPRANQYNLWTFTFIFSSLLSLIIGSILGLTQFRIKRLYAYSTISHIGFILLALAINSVESIQSFIFYLMQYSLTNLNAFAILIAIGYYLYQYSNNNVADKKELDSKLPERNNSPVQLLTDLKGFFHINPVLALSLAITLFSFAGIPPLIGFFAKQMVLISALDKGYVFMALIAILTSVISAVYYLSLIRLIFFDKNEDQPSNGLNKISVKNDQVQASFHIGDSLTLTISMLTLITLLFMLSPQEWLNITTILSLIIFNC